MERKLKLTLFLMVTCCTSVRSLEQKTKEKLLETAAAQLERLAPIRKMNQVAKNSSENLQDFFRYHANKTNQEVTRTNEKFDELRLPLQLLQMLTDTKLKGSESEIAKRGDTQESISNYLQEASYDPTMQERTKRSGSNSGSFVSGIATKDIDGIFNASSGASRGSSSSSDPQPHSYGPTAYLPPVYTYEQQSFDIWSFKKAIFNTLLQAIKAIGGGVLALKGQLIKGGGFLVSTKGRIISSTGEAISSLGRNIASSTYVVAPKPVYSHSGYAYNPPPSHPSGHSGQDIYPGPPPSANGYTTTGFGGSYQGSNSFGAASDVVYAYAFYPTRPKYRIGKRYARILSASEAPRKELINALR